MPPTRGSSRCRGVSRPISAGFPPMRAGIARRNGRRRNPAVPWRGAHGVRARFLHFCEIAGNQSSVVPVLIPGIPAGSHNDRNDGGCAGRRPAFPGLRIIRLSSGTRFRWASPNCAGVNAPTGRTGRRSRPSALSSLSPARVHRKNPGAGWPRGSSLSSDQKVLRNADPNLQCTSGRSPCCCRHPRR